MSFFPRLIVALRKPVVMAVKKPTPLTYIGAGRLRQAAELLRQTNRTVLDIAGQFGYDNASKFAKAFRDVIGVSPREYRSGAEYDSCAPRLHNADAD